MNYGEAFFETTKGAARKGVHEVKVYEPIWRRIGLDEPPGINDGNNVGMIIIDDIAPHSSFKHLGKRLVKAKVSKDNELIISYPALEFIDDQYDDHGQLALQILSHPAMTCHNDIHIGMAPAATFVLLSASTPEKLKIGLDLLIKRRMEWNLQIVLNFLVPNTQTIGLYQPTARDPWVEAIIPAVQAGLLVIAANGNTKAHNNLHPSEFFTIGGYDDQGFSDRKKHKTHPSVPIGFNGDGHLRPDILVPSTYLPVPNLEKDRQCAFSYFEGSCGSSTIVAGFCALLLSRFPTVDSSVLRKAIIHFGDYSSLELPVPQLNASKVVKAFEDNSYENIIISSSQEARALLDRDGHKRALRFSELIQEQKITREGLWQSIQDASPTIRKAAIFALGSPQDQAERGQYWHQFRMSSYETGEKTLWLNALL